MLNYKRILMATDFSKDSDKVAKKVLELVAQSGGKIDIVHVLEHTPIIYGGEFAIPLDIDLEATLKAHASKALATFCAEHGLSKATQHIAEGSVKRSVVELAEALNIDLIVVGSHGHHGLGIFSGSSAHGILHHAHCDVLIVHLES